MGTAARICRGSNCDGAAAVPCTACNAADADAVAAAIAAVLLPPLHELQAWVARTMLLLLYHLLLLLLAVAVVVVAVLLVAMVVLVVAGAAARAAVVGPTAGALQMLLPLLVPTRPVAPGATQALFRNGTQEKWGQRVTPSANPMRCYCCCCQHRCNRRRRLMLQVLPSTPLPAAVVPRQAVWH